MLLDDATGQGWRVLTWNNDPTAFLSAPTRAALDRLGARLVQVVPRAQLPWARKRAAPDVTLVGDLGGEPSLQAWFDARPVGAVVLRPDHVIAAECLSQELDDVVTRVLEAARAVG